MPRKTLRKKWIVPGKTAYDAVEYFLHRDLARMVIDYMIDDIDKSKFKHCILYINLLKSPLERGDYNKNEQIISFVCRKIRY